MAKSEQEVIEALNKSRPAFIDMMGGELKEVDFENKACALDFNVGTDLCHSVDIIQGGFITAMLDAAMGHAVLATMEGVTNVSSLEIKTSYLEVSRAGRYRAEGIIIKASYKTAFMEAKLLDENGQLTATCSSVGKLIRAK